VEGQFTCVNPLSVTRVAWRIAIDASSVYAVVTDIAGTSSLRLRLCTNGSRSAFSCSLCVSVMPCGAPGETMSVAPSDESGGGLATDFEGLI